MNLNQTFRRVKDAAAKDPLSLRVENTAEIGMLELFKKGRHYGRATGLPCTLSWNLSMYKYCYDHYHASLEFFLLRKFQIHISSENLKST